MLKDIAADFSNMELLDQEMIASYIDDSLDLETRCSSASHEESKATVVERGNFKAHSRVKNLSIVDCEIQGLPKLLEKCGSQ